MRRLISSIVFLTLLISARGQSAYSYRYWFDNNLATAHIGTANGESALEIDMSTLRKGAVHALHLQGLTGGEKWSPVCTTYFFASNDDSKAVTARYWFDDGESTVKTAPTVNGLIMLDIDHLEAGIHTVHYQTFNAANEASPARTTYFYVDEDQQSTLSCQLWIDDDEDAKATYALTGDDIVISAEYLSIGMHTLHAVLLDAYGRLIAEDTDEFEVKEPTVTITLKATMGTFCYEKDVDFTGVEGLRAYTATGFNKQTGVVMMSRVNDVPAGEGLVLLGEAGTYEVPVRTSFSYYANLMVGTLEDTVIRQTEGGFTNYIVSRKDGVMGFYLAPDQSTSAAGKAYLHVPSREANGARDLRMLFDDETTGIDETTANEKGEPYYGLTGIKTRQPQRGLYIKGNRKVIIK